ncbi:Y-box-binding protein 2-A-like [Stegodyphus dumicola]|uniref:Y-box-binding protein 2-A-like n=1 Tax=Stegodyphus dumicola TaxID=202533 RepID=UPI0015ACDC72|nr:Y-box-binding protein 2-A-like [Stegodyphus dumicola]
MDTKEDIFVHQTAIKKNNTKSAVRSVGYGELGAFEVVQEKRNEAANLIGLNRTSVKNSPYAANRNRHCGQLFSKHHFMPRQRQNDESDGSQSQENVDDKQQLQPQRPVRRQLRHPYFRQYCSYLSIGLPRNVGRDGSEDEQNERKNEERVSGGGRDNHWNPRRFYQRCFNSKTHYHRNDTECSQSRMEGEATSKDTEANDEEQQPRGQGSRSCPLYRSKMGCRKPPPS